MKYSLMLTTVRDFNALEPLFKINSPDAELVIIDPQHKESIKQKLEEIDHDFCKVTYAPNIDNVEKTDEYSSFKYKKDKMRCQNTGFAFCEGEWIYKLDDCTEFCPDFFKILDEDITMFQQKFGNKNFVIRPVKLEGWMGHQKWQELPSLQNYKERYFFLNRKSYFETLDQFIATRESIDLLNGMDERYDVGHGYDDNDIMQRFITMGYKVILDRNLKTFQTGHQRIIDPIPFSRWIYETEYFEIINGRYQAYNPYNIKKAREELKLQKEKYVIKKSYLSEAISAPKVIQKPVVEVFDISSGQPLNTVKAYPKGFSDYKPGPGHFTGEYPIDKFFNEQSLADNHNKIVSLKDKHLGKSVFLLGNSRSITKKFIDKIRDKISFAANGFIACRDIWDFEPTYFTMTDPGIFDPHLYNTKPEFTIDGETLNGKSEYELLIKAKRAKFALSDLIIKPFLYGNFNYREERLRLLEDNIHIKVLNKEELTPPHMCQSRPTYEDLSFDLLRGTYTCGTIITDMMIPLAVWMGFKNIYLKGCSGAPGKFFDNITEHFWKEDYQKYIYQDLYALFKRKLDEHKVNIYNLDSPDDPEPRGQWQLGKEPYLIEHKNLI